MGSQRTALITGGASGIGLASAAKLRDEGFDVVIADLDPRAEEVAADLGVAAQALDVTSLPDWQRLGKTLDAAGRELGALVLNAGIAGGGTDLGTLDLERYHRLMQVNVDGVLYGLRTMLPRLARPGVVTVTASLAGLMGVPADPVYAMTKHAVIGLVRSTAAGLAAQGVRIHALCPGFVETPLLAPAKSQLAAVDFPLLTPDEIAAALADLVTGRSTAVVTVLQPAAPPSTTPLPGSRAPGCSTAPRCPTYRATSTSATDRRA